MKKSVLLILALAFVMYGCKKMDPMTDLDSVIVSAEDFIAEAEDFCPQTKTSLATSRKVVWSEDDQIAIFQGSSLADRFQISEESAGNSNGVFSFLGNPGVENGDYNAGTETTLETNVALYPYQDGIECSAITDEEDVVISYTIAGVTIPANQIYAEDSFAEESFIMAAVTAGVVDHNLKFKNVCGAIKLQLKGDRTIKSISVAGKGDEVIAGEGVVTVYTDGAAPSVVMDESGEKVITLDCSEDGGVELSQEEVTVFVISVPPTPFENGFTVTITDDEDNIETLSASAGTSVERSVITVMPEIDLDEEEVLTSAYLPDGPTFKSTVDAFMTGKGITGIKFITNSATTSEDALVDGSIYLVQNGQTLEIHTAADQFVANNDCSLMFTGYKYEDNTHYIGVCDSFSNIESIDFGDNFNTHNVTDMSDMFSGCSALTSLDVTKFNTENVTSMFSMFSGCSALASLDVRNFDTKNVWTMYCMFELCRSLTSLDVTNFNTKKVSDMTRLFGGCSGLTSLDVANFNTENVTGMDGMFNNCMNLTSLDITNFNTENVTNMTSMFNGCKGLVSLDLSNFNTGNVTYMNYMFSDCSSLTSLDLSSFTFGANPSIIWMFSGTGSEATNKPIPIYVNADGKSYIETNGNSSINGNYATLTVKETAYLPDGLTFKSTVDAFMTGKGIIEIKFITNSTTTSEDALVDGSIYLVQNGQTLEIHTAASQYMANSDCSRMFYARERWDPSTQQVILNSFGQIQTIDFGENFNTQNVTDMDYMFRECSSLTSLDVSNFNTQNVTDMYWMFCGCSSLTSLDVSNFDTKNVTSLYGMFEECTSLTSLDLSNFTFESNPDVESMFYSTGSNATNKPITIYVSAEGKDYIETKGNTDINSNYATLTIKAPQIE